MTDLEAIINTAKGTRILTEEIVKCFYCHQITHKHKKCKRCDILLHIANKRFITPRSTWQLTQEAYKNSEICRDCYIEFGENMNRIDNQINNLPEKYKQKKYER